MRVRRRQRPAGSRPPSRHFGRLIANKARIDGQAVTSTHEPKRYKALFWTR